MPQAEAQPYAPPVDIPQAPRISRTRTQTKTKVGLTAKADPVFTFAVLFVFVVIVADIVVKIPGARAFAALSTERGRSVPSGAKTGATPTLRATNSNDSRPQSNMRYDSLIDSLSRGDKEASANAAPQMLSLSAPAAIYVGQVTNRGGANIQASLSLYFDTVSDSTTGHLVVGPPLGGSGSFSAIVRGGSLQMESASTAGDTIRWLATEASGQFVGSYTVVGGVAKGQTGVWQAARTSGANVPVTANDHNVSSVGVIVTNDKVYSENQVDKPVMTAPGSPSPRYPDSLKSAGVEGEVVVSFTVDTTGHAVLSTLNILKSTHELFAAAVRTALPIMRFLPAEVGGNKVKQLVQQPFVFNIVK